MILLVVLEGYDLIGGTGRLWSYWWYCKAMILLEVLEGSDLIWCQIGGIEGYDLIGGIGRL